MRLILSLVLALTACSKAEERPESAGSVLDNLTQL